jgi:hypothetical protein
LALASTSHKTAALPLTLPAFQVSSTAAHSDLVWGSFGSLSHYTKQHLLSLMRKYYTYAYLRENGTPYYVGRGKGERAYQKHTNVKTPPKERILFLKQV